MKTDGHFLSFLAQFLLELEMLQTKVVEKIKSHILCPITFFPLKSCCYEIMWKNIVEQDRPQITTGHMRIACWVPKARHTHLQYVIRIAFPLQQWLHERSSKLHCTRTLPVMYIHVRATQYVHH